MDPIVVFETVKEILNYSYQLYLSSAVLTDAHCHRYLLCLDLSTSPEMLHKAGP